jgi:hypothetical protein
VYITLEMELRDFLLFAGPLLGVILGGGITILLKLVELGHQRKQEDRKFLLQKLETLYHAVGRFPNTFLKTSLAVQRHLDRALSGRASSDEEFNQALRDVNAELIEIAGMMDLYCSEGRIFLDLVIQKLTEFNVLTTEIAETGKYNDKIGTFTKQISSSSKFVLSAIQAKIEKQALIIFHEPTSFSENLALTMEKRFRFPKTETAEKPHVEE